MSLRWGQAGRVFVRIGQAVGLVLGLGLVAIVALVVRLTHGPMQVTGLVRHFAAHPAGGATLSLTSATLMWDRAAASAPLVLALTNPALARPDGTLVLQAAAATLALRPSPLLLGRIEPVAITAAGGSLALRRTAAGQITLDIRPSSKAKPAPRSPPARKTIWRLPDDVQLTNLAIVLTDQSGGGVWTVRIAMLRLAQAASPRPAGRADFTLQRAGQSSRVLAQLARIGTTQSLLTATIGAIVPASLSPAAAAFDLPVALALQARLGPRWQWLDGAIQANLGAGQLKTATGAVPVAGGTLKVAIQPGTHTATLTQFRLALAGKDQAPGPIVTATGQLDWTARPARATLAIDLDRVAFADLGRYWPTGIGSGARAWLTANATDGLAEAAHADLTLDLDGGEPTLRAASGHLQAQNLTLHWLRPIPPLIHGSATLTLLSPDALTIALSRASQTPSDPQSLPLAVTAATMRITGLNAAHQPSLIEADLAGPVPQLLALLREPRLHLLAAHPMALGVATGAVTAHLHVALPLDNAVTIDQIDIHAKGNLNGLHLGGLLAGRDLDQGQLAFDVANAGLTLSGPAALAGIPSQLTVALDFRAGPPSQVVSRYGLTATATAAQLQQAGIPTGGLVQGEAGIAASVTERRDDTGQVRLHVDLSQAGLVIGPLGFHQGHQSGRVADALILLDHDRLVGVDHLSVTGDGVSIDGRAAYEGGKPVALSFERIVLGQTNAAGTIHFATPQNPALRVDLHGSVLDLSAPAPAKSAAAPATPNRAEAQQAASVRKSKAAAAPRGAGWVADLRFGEVRLGPGRILTAVSVQADHDGLLLTHARIAGAAAGAGFRATLAPAGLGRALHGSADDAGALLRALDIASTLRGGRLTLDGGYDDRQPDAALAGTVRIDDFRLAAAPAVTRLLQAMTLYGVVDVLRGPGLGFTHLVAPFRLADNVLSLNGARAFSQSLGFTAKGDIDLTAQRADLQGTIVPAYFFNTLLGHVPVVGKLFSPEQGGGLLAASYKVTGSLTDPQVQINPLTALTPGFLRGLFGVFDHPAAANP